MKAIVRKVDVRESLDSLYAHCKQCREEVHLMSGQGCIQSTMEDWRKRIIDCTGPYRYCETCDDIKYHVVEEETSAHNELPVCIGCWSKDQSVKEGKEPHSKDLGRAW